VTKDYVEAVKCFQKAAENGFVPAQRDLGVCYVNGQGIEKNNIEAYKWWLIAKANGDEVAAKYLLTLEREMSSDQIAKSQELARNFKATRTSDASGGNLAKPDKF